MSTYFLFSDECGAYIKEPDEGFLNSHPYYVRTSLLIPSEQYRELSSKYLELKEAYNLPKIKEIKWSFLWHLRIIQKNDDQLNPDHELFFLKDYDYHTLIDFVEESVELIKNTPGALVISTVSKNIPNWKMEKKRFYEMHIENHMQRVQFEMTDNNHDIAVMFFDSVGNRVDKLIRTIYSDLVEANSFEIKFSHIKDSLNIEYSHQSIGVQLADFASGVVNSFFKAQHNPNNYERGLKMFHKSIKPIIRSIDGNLCGYGLIEIPSKESWRKEIKDWLNNN